VVFLLVKAINKMMPAKDNSSEETPTPTKEEKYLSEIVEILKKTR